MPERFFVPENTEVALSAGLMVVREGLMPKNSVANKTSGSREMQ
ncbi:MAG: hypothetical protein AAF413_03350 [Patescibacteria group bacterium]